MQINATITGLQYQVFLAGELETIKSKDFDINTCPTSSIYSDKKLNFAVSKWVSPKRTRSYPYERVYNTLANGKKITVIPVVKDEGFDGDRDFIQWDKEALATLTKAKITITNYLGGQYFLTVDEIRIDKKDLYLIEGKHSKSSFCRVKATSKTAY